MPLACHVWHSGQADFSCSSRSQALRATRAVPARPQALGAPAHRTLQERSQRISAARSASGEARQLSARKPRPPASIPFLALPPSASICECQSVSQRHDPASLRVAAGAGGLWPSLCRRGPAVLLWDLENVRPFGRVEAWPVQLSRLKAYLTSGRARRDSVEVLTSLNTRSLARARASGLLGLLEHTDVAVLPCSDFNDAADVTLTSAAYQRIQAASEAQTHCKLVLACVTQDTGFAPLLQYARSKGVHTIAVSPFTQGLRPSSAALAPPHATIQRSPLAQAADAAVMWVPVATSASAYELQLVQTAKALVLDIGTNSAVMRSRSSGNGNRDRRLVPGVVDYVWFRRESLV